MNSLTSLGKYFFITPILVFGIFHLVGAQKMADQAPFGGVAMIYVTGICLVAFGISALLGKFDKLAAILLSVLMILIITLIHLKGATMNNGMAMVSALKDLSIAGGVMMYAHAFAKDNSLVG